MSVKKTCKSQRNVHDLDTFYSGRGDQGSGSYQNEIKHPVINVLPLVWLKNLSFLCSIISGFSISAYDTHTP